MIIISNYSITVQLIFYYIKFKGKAKGIQKRVWEVPRMRTIENVIKKVST